MKTKDQVLIESMFAYADHGIDPCILTENVGHTSVLVEASGEAASLFSRLNDGRKELMKKVENIDWKEWLKNMRETVKKIIRFITAPVRTAAELATGKTTLKEVGQRLKQVWTNLKNKRNKTPEEKTAEKAVGEIIQDVEKAQNTYKPATSKYTNAMDILNANIASITRAFDPINNSKYGVLNIIIEKIEKFNDANLDVIKEITHRIHNEYNKVDFTNLSKEDADSLLNDMHDDIDRLFYINKAAWDINKEFYDYNSTQSKLAKSNRYDVTPYAKKRLKELHDEIDQLIHHHKQSFKNLKSFVDSGRAFKKLVNYARLMSRPALYKLASSENIYSVDKKIGSRVVNLVMKILLDDIDLDQLYEQELSIPLHLKERSNIKIERLIEYPSESDEETLVYLVDSIISECRVDQADKTVPLIYDDVYRLLQRLHSIAL